MSGGVGFQARTVLIARTLVGRIAGLAHSMFPSPVVAVGLRKSAVGSRACRPPTERSDEVAAPVGLHQEQHSRPHPQHHRERRYLHAEFPAGEGSGPGGLRLKQPLCCEPGDPYPEDAALGEVLGEVDTDRKPEPPGENMGSFQEHVGLDRGRSAP